MGFHRLKYKKKTSQDMIDLSTQFMNVMATRRSVREFSDEDIPDKVLENIIRTAMSAPSGANKEPWQFSVVKDKTVKKKIRKAAEEEEKKFYKERATEEWLKDLNKFATDWRKPFLEEAPALIVVFRQSYDNSGSLKRKNYYVGESVGIASGFLITAIHNAGLVSLTHTPSPMGFLEKILKRPTNEKAFLLIPVGYPEPNTQVPMLKKRRYKNTVRIY
ncbi:nitroreductase family protein [bacterium]|jgi:nitroreductase|nr:nitroreductase family protein [bacterium]MBT5734782.1 nitroreductase family protein [bacterium]MBT6018049.1 nitroreductase family protein [bacterium]